MLKDNQLLKVHNRNLWAMREMRMLISTPLSCKSVPVTCGLGKHRAHGLSQEGVTAVRGSRVAHVYHMKIILNMR
jgi:hypothetical protein